MISLAEAIAQQENTNPSLNNPCALTAAPGSFCQNGKSGILVDFCSIQDGWNACNNQISLNVGRGLNLSEFFGGKTGVYPGYSNAASGNDPVAYTSNVSSWTGIEANSLLNSIDPSQLYYSSGDGTIASNGSITLDPGMSSGIDFSSINPLYIGLGLLGLVVISKLL